MSSTLASTAREVPMEKANPKRLVICSHAAKCPQQGPCPHCGESSEAGRCEHKIPHKECVSSMTGEILTYMNKEPYRGTYTCLEVNKVVYCSLAEIS